MLKFYIQFLIMLVFFLHNKKEKKTWFCPSNILLGLYLMSTACGIGLLYIADYTDPFKDKIWWCVLAFDITLILFLLPFKRFNENKVENIVLPNRKTLDFLSNGIIILSIYAIIYYVGSARYVLSMSDLSMARNAMVAGEETYIEAGFMNTIASVSSSLYVFALLFFFIYTAIGGNETRRFLLLISSFSEPLHILSFVGRDGIVFWIFSFVFLYSFFYRFLSKENNKIIRKSFLYIVVIFAIPFFMISTSRFGSSQTGVEGSIISYLGQGTVNGPLQFGLDPMPYTHGSGFPLFYEFTGIPKPHSIGLTEIGDWKSWTFATFVGGFLLNFGFVGMYVVCLVMLVFFNWTVGKAKRNLSLDKIIIYLLYFIVIGEGVFYFRHYTRGGNLFIIICLLFAFYLSQIKRTKFPVVLRKQ